MIFSLSTFFDKFCDYLDGKIKWSEKKTNLTKLIFEFFSQVIGEQQSPLVEEKEYMMLDYTARQKIPEYSTNMIELALEHEVSQRKPLDVLSREVQHLVDIKAKYKIGVFYPSTGDENQLKKEIENKIKQSSYLSVPWEEYLFILGFPTTREGKRSILFKAFQFTWNRQGNYQNLEVKQLKERIIKQKETTKI